MSIVARFSVTVWDMSMSEADLPLNQSPSEGIPEYEAGKAKPLNNIADPWDDDWETVNFPNAIAIDQIPVVQESSEHSSVTEKPLPSVVMDAVDSNSQTPLIKALHTCNRDLIDRIAELEEELEQCHQQLQQHHGNSNQQFQELSFTRAQVTRLFKKLDVANRVIQQQQVLVETLTKQWDTSQTRMAKMERECAVTQQRYNEQFHELVKVQNDCREMRSRLHRQQRYTLQFKAALERSLEMQSHNLHDSQLVTESVPPEVDVDDQLLSPSFVIHSQINLSKALPVQPWSAELPQPPVEDLPESTKNSTQNQNISNPSQGIPPLLSTQEGLESKPQPSEENLGDSQNTDRPSADISLESIVPPGEPVVEEWPKPRLVEEELNRIRLEYAAPPSENENSDQELELASVGSRQETGNWPAPLVYPQHRRKLQSLSAIKLPTFPTKTVDEDIEF